MKLLDLFEARNWQDITDRADRWLAKFTYENMDRYPSEEIISTLQKRYPYDGGTIYRGMNFHTKEEYDEFLSSLDKNVMTMNRVSSWSENQDEAKSFAITRPSYTLNLATMQAYDEAEKSGEEISGYCGVIVSTTVSKNVGIDVNKSNLGHESEVILPPGSYKIVINRLKKFSEMVKNVANFDDIILKSSKEDYYKKSQANYVLRNHALELSTKAQNHLFDLFYPHDKEIFKSEFMVDPFFKNEGTGRLHLSFPTMIFDLYAKDVFSAPKLESKIKKLATDILDKAVPVIGEYINKSDDINMKGIMYLVKLTGNANAIKQIMSMRHAYLSDEGRKLNDISDPKEKQNAIRKHAENLKNFMQMFSH